MTAGAIAAPTVIPLRPPLPGRLKTSIDSNTKIEINSDSPLTDIYYTLNSTRPDPFQPHWGKEPSTYFYNGPFTLPAGKHTVKALAVAKDGLRESNVVTKVFEVEHVSSTVRCDTVDDEVKFQEEIAREREKIDVKRAVKNLRLSTRSAWAVVQSKKNTSQILSDLTTWDSNKRRPYTSGPRFTNGHLDSALTVDMNTSAQGLLESTVNLSCGYDQRKSSGKRQLPENSLQTIRLQKELDFLKCACCFSDRPTEPSAKFCNVCGESLASLPRTQNVPPPEPEQMCLCFYCNSMVPFNVSSCAVCEAPIPSNQNPPAPTSFLQCDKCLTPNPSKQLYCLVCENKLEGNSQVVYHHTTPPTTEKRTRMFKKCTKCERVNNKDARFCDWCGMQHLTTSLQVCSKCKTNNDPYASFCVVCGMHIQPPNRMAVKHSNSLFKHETQWLPVSFPLGVTVASQSVATQTVGLFYPSSRGLIKKQEQEDEKAVFEKLMRDRQPLLTPVSPGRGYWRKQVEHICQHLKAHAQNNAEFRSVIGEPKMGKLLSGIVEEDEFELSLTLKFVLRGMKDSLVNTRNHSGSQDLLNSYRDIDNELSSFCSEPSEATEATDVPSSSRLGKKKAKKVKRPKSAKRSNEVKISPIDKKLLKELGPNSKGSGSETQQLLDDGADPNCVNKAGLPALHVAVRNKHTDTICILIKAGAALNCKGPPSLKGNTALHEAINLGHSGLLVLDALLNCGADINKKNDQGETAYDLAVKCGCEPVVTKLAAAIGQAELQKIIKTRHSD